MATRQKKWVGNSTTPYDTGCFDGKGWQKKIVRRLKRLDKKRNHKRERQRAAKALDSDSED